MTEETKKEDAEEAEVENPYTERAEEILRFMDDSTQTFVLLFLDYSTGDFEVVCNANTAEEAVNIMMEGVEYAKEDCLEENKPEWPVDNRLH